MSTEAQDLLFKMHQNLPDLLSVLLISFCRVPTEILDGNRSRQAIARIPYGRAQGSVKADTQDS